ncbi:alpha/beta hydrolase family protein [Streptomyces sp. NPDC012935]|uniref:alpha/beta hydrolase family protein n=1 Tax=Streptomyces sp. NPDC012935 TaxID=3364857 RepID=UPI0036B69F3D
MSYRPFARGSSPVGVRTLELSDETRESRPLTIEIWYPADARFLGQDLDPATADHFTSAPGLPEAVQHAVRDAAPAVGTFPLLLTSHAAASHRRDGAFAATHLASHGYVVAAPDHSGDTQADLIGDALAADTGAPPRRLPDEEICVHRPLDVLFTLDHLLSGADAELAALIDPERIGMYGVSLGGWTTLTTNALDRRLKASLVAAPSYGTHGPFPQTAMQTSLLRLDWGRPVPTFVIAGECDSLVVLSDLRELYDRLQPPKRFAVLSRASHFHWAENGEELYEQVRPMWESGLIQNAGADLAALASIPFSALCPNRHATDTLKALCLAHMDTHLKGSAAARAYLDKDVPGSFTDRGIGLETVSTG